MPTIARRSGPQSDAWSPRRSRWPLGDALLLEPHGVTDIGPERPTNDDAFVADLAPTAHGWLPLAGVADGVGAHAGGARASRLALRTVVQETRRRLRNGEWTPGHDTARVETSVSGIVHACQDALVRCGAADPALARMATTLTLGLFRGPVLHVAHVGDSRAYLLRGGVLTRLTLDHTMAQVLAGSDAEPIPETSRLQHMLINVLAAHHTSVEVDTQTLALRAGDTLLFCTDGLSGALSDDALRAALADGSAAAAAQRLVDEALDADGADNVTAVVARVLPAPRART
jgi:serine/threonine protein phosphatase PrpC